MSMKTVQLVFIISMTVIKTSSLFGTLLTNSLPFWYHKALLFNLS